MTTISAGDFLKTAAATPLSGHYLAAGVHLQISTNSEPILKAAREAFDEIDQQHEALEELHLRFWVENSVHAREARSKPYFRGLDHLVFGGIDGRSSFLINLRDRRGIGRLTPEVASDTTFWKTRLFPILLTILGPSVGLTPLHCACVAWKGSGLLLAGESGAGKSTLTLALAQAGFDFVSDDRTLIGEYRGRLLAWGLSGEIKLRAESIAQFPVLNQIKPIGELSRGDILRFDPTGISGISQVRCCEPRWLFFLERQSQPAFRLVKMTPGDSVHHLVNQLHRQTPEIQERQCRTIENLVARESYQLRYGGDPHASAGGLHSLVVHGWKGKAPIGSSLPARQLEIAGGHNDPLRRFRATPLSCDVHLMEKSIRLETNNPIILKHVETTLNCQKSAGGQPSQFLWRIVSEPGTEVAARWPAMTAFSDDNVRYINLGQHSFIAVDLKARQAVGIIPEQLANDETGFLSVFLASMFYLTAPALGLVAISAGCVAIEGRGVLLFGVPGSGKTTASYRSTRLGLEFHADQAVFLETKADTLRAWGDFWPAAFREDASELFPELAHKSRPLAYCDRTFLCIGKNSSRPLTAHSVVPVCCIFLHRQAGASPRLISAKQEEGSRLAAFVPFVEDADPDSNRGEIFNSLSRLPAYRLAYGSDSSEAAVFFRSVLSTHHPMEDPS